MAAKSPNKSNYDYLASVFTGSGRLGMFSHEEHILKKTRNKHGIHQLLAVIAEDSGPFPGGDHASDLAIDAISDFFNSSFFSEMDSARENPVIEEQLRKVFNDISFSVFNRGRSEGAQVRLSLTMLLLIENRLYAAHVGTNRILKIIDDKTVFQLTEDHSWSSQAMMQQGIGQAVAQRNMKNMNIPTIGLEAEPDIRVIMQTVNPGERLVLCSDGITEFIPNQEITVILNSVDTLQGACNRLVSIAQDRGMRDNATIIAIAVTTEQTTGKYAQTRSVNGIVKKAEKKKKSIWGFLYFFIVIILLAVMGAAGYVGYRYAQKVLYNMGMIENPGPTSTPSPAGSPGLIETGSAGGTAFFLVKDPQTMSLNYFRLNNRKLEESKEKFELVESFNTLELLPDLSKDTYTLNLKINAKDRYKVYEGNSRNVIQLYQNEVKVYLTQGAVVSFIPDETDGIINVEMSGLESPVRVTFERQNVILKVTRDTGEE